MGSFFAGVKAGTLGGILYAGGLGFFAAFVLVAFKQDVMAHITQQYANFCGATGAPTNSSSLQFCYSSQFDISVPVFAFVIFFVALFWAVLFGIWYERVPGRGPATKGEVLATAMVVVTFLVIGAPYGFAFDFDTTLASGTFLIAWSLVFGYVLSRLYRRYTRLVTMDSQNPDLLKVLVDGHDFTGRTRTFAYTSNHRLKAEVSSDASFKEWEVSGGLAVEDPRSFETVVEINGDGTLKGVVSKKY